MNFDNNCNCRLKLSENSQVDDRNDTAAAASVCHSLSQQKNLPNVLADEKMRPCEFSTSPVTDTVNMNRLVFRPKPGKQHSSEELSSNTLSKEAMRVDWKIKPELSDNKPSKQDTSGPVIAAVEGGFHTQYLLFTRNDVASATAAAKSAFLLKIQSNCCWDSIRSRILQLISKQCPDNTVYPLVDKLHIDGFVVEILPKTDRPEILPPDVQKRMMSRSLHAICIRITVDHSVMSSPLCTSLATGLSAFTKLKFKFPSEKTCRNNKSLQNSVKHKGSVVPQLSTSDSFEPFTSKPIKTVFSPLTAAETVTQSTNVTITSGNLETKRLHATEPTNSVCRKPAILCSSSLSSAASSSGCSTKSSLTTTDVGDADLPQSNTTECAGQPVKFAISPDTELSASTGSNMQSVTSPVSADNNVTEMQSSTSVVVSPASTRPPLTSLSSALGSFLCTDSSVSEKILPDRGPDSMKCTEFLMQSTAEDTAGSIQTLKTVPGSLCDIRQNLHETSSPAEVIVVASRHLPLDTSICQLPVSDAGAATFSIDSSSVQFSTTASSHPSNSSALQSVDKHNNSISSDQSVSNIPVLSEACMCPVSLAADEISLLTVPVTSVSSPPSLNITSSQLASSEQSVLMETAGLQAVALYPGDEYTAAKMEQVTESQQNETVECSVNTAEGSLTGVELTEDDSTAKPSVNNETAALDIAQPLVNKTCNVDSLISGEELSNDAENYSAVEQKDVDISQQRHDLEYESIASTGAEEVVSRATSSDSQLSLLAVDSDEFKSVRSAEQSSVTDSEQQQPCSTEVPDVQIVLSDEVHTFCGWLR